MNFEDELEMTTSLLVNFILAFVNIISLQYCSLLEHVTITKVYSFLAADVMRSRVMIIGILFTLTWKYTVLQVLSKNPFIFKEIVSGNNRCG